MNRCSRAVLLLSPILVFLAIVCTPAVGSATTVATPTFTPTAGTYTSAQSVTISDATSGVTIYYTINGTTPTSSSNKYTAAISVSTSETIKAIAEHSGDTNSAVATAKYTIPPTIGSLSTTSGGLNSPVTITGTNFGSTQSTNTVTFNGTPAAVTTWSSTSILMSVPLAATTGNVVVTVSGVASNGVAFTVLPTTPTPTFSPAAGNYPYSGINVVINDSDAAATIYCTTDGTTPISSSSSFICTGINAPIWVSSNETLKAIAVDPALANSPMATAAYTIQAWSPTFSPVAGGYVGPQTVTIENQYNSGSVYYTVTSGTTGTPPTNKSTNSSSKTIPITVSSTETIEAYGTHWGNSQSSTAIATYTITSVLATRTAATGLSFLISASSGSNPLISIASVALA